MWRCCTSYYTQTLHSIVLPYGGTVQYTVPKTTAKQVHRSMRIWEYEEGRLYYWLYLTQNTGHRTQQRYSVFMRDVVWCSERCPGNARTGTKQRDTVEYVYGKSKEKNSKKKKKMRHPCCLYCVVYITENEPFGSSVFLLHAWRETCLVYHSSAFTTTQQHRPNSVQRKIVTGE